MAEAVGLAAGIIGIVVPALHGARLLLRDLEKITNVPDAMAKLKEDVASISASLVLLKDIDEPVWLSLGRWTKRSKGATLSWLDRVQVGFFRDQQLKAHTARLHAYRLTFNSIVETATLYSSFRTAQLTDELRSSIAFAPEVRSLPASDITVDEDAELDTTITGLTEVLEALNLSQTLLQELSSKTESADNAKADADNKTTNITFGTNNQGMQMGNNYGTTTWTSKG